MSYKLVEEKTDQTNSVEVSRTSKGDYSWSIKVYCTEGGFDQALAEIYETDQNLRKKYRVALPTNGEEPIRPPETEPKGPKKPVRHEVKRDRPLEEEEEKPRGKRRSKEELVAAAKKPFRRPEEPEEEEPAPTFRRRR